MNATSESNPIVSFVLSTHNRREIVRNTIGHIHDCGLDPRDYEILIVDNASLDGTPEMIASKMPEVILVALDHNLGACAKNSGIERASGQYLVFLDDDSYPEPGSIQRMIEHFEADPYLGAAVFTVTLPTGQRECCAYPSVFIGCGTGFRATAIKQVGPLPIDFFMAAEEYDLSLRLLDAGWYIRNFDDLHVTHLKSPTSRNDWRLMRLDVRNNFILATRYLPSPWTRQFLIDWMVRYYRIAASKGQRSAFAAGLLQGMVRALQPGHRRAVSEAVFEQFTMRREIELHMTRVKQQLGLKKVLFIDYGKNVLPYWLAAKSCGLTVVAIADQRLCGRGHYRGAPIVDDALARCLDFEAAIISNMSPVHAQQRALVWRELDRRPVIDLFDPHALEQASIQPAPEQAELAA